MFRAIARWWNGADDSVRGLPAADEIHRLLHRERARADRTQSALSVLVYRCPADGGHAVRLIQVLRQRLRNTDEVGWLDAERLCAVLPDTPAVGAWKVVDDVARTLPADLPLPGCLVYTYPDQPAASLFGDATPPETTHTMTEEERLVTALELLLIQNNPSWKRAVDVVASGAALVVLAPLLLLIAAIIKLTSRGPVLFCQRRSGRGGRPFQIYKFRTMVVDAEARKRELKQHNEVDGPAFKMKNDPRVTTIGRLLRATSLDELPQLWNVFVGDMSLVGPRPLPCDETSSVHPWQRQRLLVTPGLTCIWQVHGRCRVSFADWMRMDVRYIRSRSLWHDTKLILQTIPAVLFQRGAH
ncbi:MAG: sugar transferase [Gemmataceae bacterium]